MNNSEYLDKVHSEILSIMDYIDEICTKNGFKYYLTGGTLLGAVRHKGFIPWDDDLDIEMPRRDYELFLDCVREDDKFDVIDYRSSSVYPRFFAKVLKRGTLFIEEDMFEWGIFVDIFPVDNEKTYGKHLEIKKKIVRYFLNNRNRLSQKDKSKKIKYYISKLLPPACWVKLMEFIAINPKKDKYEYYINFGSQYSAMRRTMPKEWYGEDTRLLFEGRRYCAPKEYEKFLSRVFGLNYMSIPPIEKRRTHYPKYVKFSDGVEMRFDQPKKRVTVKETLE